MNGEMAEMFNQQYEDDEMATIFYGDLENQELHCRIVELLESEVEELEIKLKQKLTELKNLKR